MFRGFRCLQGQSLKKKLRQLRQIPKFSWRSLFPRKPSDGCIHNVHFSVLAIAEMVTPPNCPSFLGGGGGEGRTSKKTQGKIAKTSLPKSKAPSLTTPLLAR